MTPDEYCRQKAAASGSSFYYSFLFLPEEKRRGITALYAFCREVDDVVDDCTDTAIARTKLAWWRNEVAAMYRGEPQHPVTRALAALLSRFNLPEERLHEIIAGMEMDLDRNRYSNFEALKLYCHRVASVVGLLSAEIFGYGDRRTRAERLRAATPDLIAIIGGAGVLLVWSGIVESYISQYHQPVLAYDVKIAFGLVESTALWLFLFLGGRR